MSDDPSDDTAAAAGRDRAGREQQIRRAREVLSDAGWLFDDFVNNEMRKVLVSQPRERDAREEAYRRARGDRDEGRPGKPDRDLRGRHAAKATPRPTAAWEGLQAR
jgi:hypothetical protein